MLLYAMVGLLVVGPALLHVVSWRARIWRERPLVELLGWLAVLVSFAALLGPVLGNPSAPTGLWRLSFWFVILAGTPLWALFGLECVNLAVDLGDLAARGLRRRLPEVAFRRVAAALALALAAGCWLFVWVLRKFYLLPPDRIAEVMEAVVAAWFGLPFLAAGWVVWRGLAGRWTIAAAATALTLVVAAPVLWAAIVLSLGEQDFLTLALSAPNLLPPRLVTIGLLAYSVLTFGAHHAAGGGGAGPRAGRVLLHLGGSVLLLAAVLASVAYRRESTVETGNIHMIADHSLKFFIFFLGPPYLVWLLWRRGSSGGAALDYVPVSVLGAGTAVFLWYVLFA